MTAVAALARFARRSDRPATPACDLCGAAIDDEHRHLVDREERTLRCACRACYLLFEPSGAGGGRWLAVPDRFEAVAVDEGWWRSLDAPVGLAFVIASSATGEPAAFYPSPAGVTEAAIDGARWAPAMTDVAQDTEALLLWHHDGETEAYIVPVDTPYRLVGRLRRVWRGHDGGSAARDELSETMADIRRRAGR